MTFPSAWAYELSGSTIAAKPVNSDFFSISPVLSVITLFIIYIKAPLIYIKAPQRYEFGFASQMQK
jgi:hypothetical protein